MTDLAIERFLAGPAPYSSGNPPAVDRPRFRTAEQELADALEGQAPRLSKTVAELLGPARTAELAQVVRRAVAVGIRRRADQETAGRLEGVYDMLASGLNQIAPECEAIEQPTEPCVHRWEPFWDGSLGYTETDRCTRCGAYEAVTEHG